VRNISNQQNTEFSAVVNETMSGIETIVIADRHALTRAGIVFALKQLEKYEIVAETADLATTMQQMEINLPSILLFEPGIFGEKPMDTTLELTRMSPSTKQIAILDERDRCCELTRNVPLSGGLMKSDGLEIVREIIQKVSVGRSAFSDAYFAASNSTKPCASLTDRERQIMGAILSGDTSRDISGHLGISVKTVENHRTNLMRKLGVHSVAKLSQWARGNQCIHGAGEG